MTPFYTNNILETEILSKEESYHCVKVLRKKSGDKIHILDGIGNIYEAEIVVPDEKNTLVKILSSQKEYSQRKYRLHIAIAPTKNIDRFEWFVEKAVEIGIDYITPIICQFSERKTIKEERLEKIVISASKQSIKAYFPKINPLTNLSDLINRTTEEERFIAHCHNTCKENLIQICKPSKNSVILIGPEGDFSLQEIREAKGKGFVPVSLSQSRLRTETAGIVAVNTISIKNSF